MKIALSGNWQLRNTKKQSYITATVPGDVFLAYLEAHLIPDPFSGTNEKDAFKLAKDDFEYIKRFNVTADFLQGDEVCLVAEQIDTLAHIFINDSLVAQVSNAHCTHRVDIKQYLIEGENIIKIVLFSPLNYIVKRNAEDAMPLRLGQVQGVAHIRKPQCHFGWDWGPFLPIMGITRDIYLESHSKARISNINVEQVHSKVDNKTLVELNIDVDIVKFTGESELTTEVAIKEPSGKVLKLKDKGTLFNFIITEPQLWWTKELSGSHSQPLYEIQAQVFYKGKVCDSATKRIGLRTIELLKEKDKFGSNFQFILNGVPLFIKGADYIPADAMITRAADKYAYYIDAMLAANMNMVRIWGGGYYELDAFYDYCDEKGLLVWQDFPFACMPYPFYNKAFLINVIREVQSNVARLKHHASLALWCGNNEIELMTPTWIHRQKLIKWTKKFFYDILPNEIRRQDNATPYAPGSPTSFEFLKKVNSEHYGCKHIWSVWHGLKPVSYYKKLYPRFTTEFGLQSMPSLDMISTFAKKEDFSLSSPVMETHQKCLDGNDKMLFYLANQFALPNDFKDLPYLTGLTQSLAICEAVEHMRRHKGRCNGALYWQLNDCWGVSSWSSIDYLGKYKPLQYRIKDAFAPLSVSLEIHKNQVDLYLINDLAEEQNVAIEYGIMDFYGNDLLKSNLPSIDVDFLSIHKINSINTEFLSRQQKRSCVFYARLYQDSKLIMQKTATFVKDKKLSLPAQDIGYTVKRESDMVWLDIQAKHFARQVEVGGLSVPLSDNYFDLLPEERKIISFRLDKDTPLKDIRINCVNNITNTQSNLANLVLRARVRTKPFNLLSSLLYTIKK